MTISTGAIAAALRPGVNSWFGNAYKRYPDEYSQIFQIETSEMNYEVDVNINGFGLAVVKQEGESIAYDSMQQGYKQTYQHVTYGTGFIITEEAMEDNLYFKMAKANTEGLAIAMKQVKETVGANILNRFNNGSYLGPDGVVLGSNAHLLSKGGTWSNVPVTNAALSETSLEQAIIDIGGYLDDAGLKMQSNAVKLVVPRQLQFTADRILDSEYQNDTADNAVNILKSGKYLPGGRTVNHFLSSSTAWFVTTDAPVGLRHFIRRPVVISNDTDFDSANMKYKATERYSFGWTDARGIYCVAGL